MTRMEKLQHILEPIGRKLGKQRHLSTISNGIMMVALITLISALINITASPPVTQELIDSGGGWILLRPWFWFTTTPYNQTTLPYNMTIGSLGLIAVFGISYRLSENYKMDSPVSASFVAIIMFLITASPVHTIRKDLATNASNLGSFGLFSAMTVDLFSAEITGFVTSRKITINLLDSVPPLVQGSFIAIIPALLNLIIWYSLSLICQNYANCLLPELIMNILAPLFNIALSPVTVILIVTFGNLLWLFGTHGTNVAYSTLMPVLM